MEKSNNFPNLASGGSEEVSRASAAEKFSFQWRDAPESGATCAEAAPPPVERLAIEHFPVEQSQAAAGRAEFLRWEHREAGRYYEATLQQDLFGGWEVWKRWGGIGQARGSQQCLPVPDLARGLSELGATARRRRARGYAVVGTSLPGPARQPRSAEHASWTGRVGP